MLRVTLLHINGWYREPKQRYFVEELIRYNYKHISLPEETVPIMKRVQSQLRTRKFIILVECLSCFTEKLNN